MTICCAVQYICWSCIMIGAFLFFIFNLVISDGLSSEPHYCSRSQLSIGAECAEKTRKIEEELLKINQTRQFLQHPSDYLQVGELCEQTHSCLKRITCEDGHEFVSEVKETIPACDFYKFYVSEFRDCAEKLLSEVKNYSCLEILFKNKFEKNKDRCQEFLDIQPCIYDAINSECSSNSTDLSEKFEKQSFGYYLSLNCLKQDEQTMESVKLMNNSQVFLS